MSKDVKGTVQKKTKNIEQNRLNISYRESMNCLIGRATREERGKSSGGVFSDTELLMSD